MANCCICKKKIIMPDNYIDNSHKICDTCAKHLKNLQVNSDSNMKIVSDSRKWFESWMDTVDSLTKNYLNARLKESKELENKTSDTRNIKIAQEEATRKEKHKKYEEHKQRLLYFKTTTGFNFEGYIITEYKNVISEEVVLGTGIFSELNASVSDTFGKQSSSLETKIKQAKDTALNSLIKRAASINTNALIGVNFFITTIGNNMIIVSVTGTAVTIEKVSDIDNNDD